MLNKEHLFTVSLFIYQANNLCIPLNTHIFPRSIFCHPGTNLEFGLCINHKGEYFNILEEKSCSVHGHGEHWDPALKTIKGTTEIEPDAMVKLIRKGAIR